MIELEIQDSGTEYFNPSTITRVQVVDEKSCCVTFVSGLELIIEEPAKQVVKKMKQGS